MILRGWHADGFGILASHHVEGLGAGVTVVFGPNEAGKSTLLRFLRFVLFGPAGARPLTPLRGGRCGGRAFLGDAQGGVWTVERHADRRSGRGPAALRDPAGRPAPPERLAALLGGVDAALFRAVFAFGLAEVAGLESLSAAAVRDQIFSAGITGAGARASRARARLDAALEELVRPRAVGARANALADALRQVRHDLAAARRDASGHPDLVAEEEAAARGAAQLAEEGEALARRERLVTALLDLWEPWNRWRQGSGRLAEFPPVGLPPRAGPRMAEARQALQLARQRLADREERRRTLARDLAAVRLAPMLEGLAGRVSEAAAGAALQRTRLQREDDARAAAAEGLRRLGERLRALGAGWTPERLDRLAMPVVVADAAQEWRRRLDAAAALGTQARERARDAAEAAAGAAGRAGDQARAAEALRDAPSRAEAAAVRARLDEVQRRLLRARALPGTLAAAAAVSLALVAVGALSRASTAGPVLGVLGILALTATIATTGRAWRAEVRALRAEALRSGLPAWPDADALDAARERARAGEEAARLREEAEAQAAAARSEADRLGALRRDLEGRAADAARAAEALGAEWAAWRRGAGLPESLSPEGIPAFVEAVRAAREAAADLRSREADAARLAGEAAEWEQEASALLREARQALPPSPGPGWDAGAEGEAPDGPAGGDGGAGGASDRGRLDPGGPEQVEGRPPTEAGRPPAGPAPSLRIVTRTEALAEAVRTAREARRRHDEASQALAELDAVLEADLTALRAAEAAHDALLAEAGIAADAGRIGAGPVPEVAGDAAAPDPDAAFDDAVALAAERAAWEARVRDLESALAGQLGSGPYGDELRAGLEAGDPAGWETEREGVRRRRRECASARERAIEERTRAAARREALEASADIPSLAAREAALVEELRRAVGEWRRLRLAKCLLDRTLERFVRDRQPEVLGEAAAVLRAVTGGRYVRLLQDPAAETRLAVEDRDGRRLEPDQLSRGTEEQLYVALRLGLAASFAPRAAALPLVLDDVLVNFDRDRAEAMLRCFGRYLAADPDRRQVLLFTCHEELAALASRVFPGCGTVLLASGAPRSAAGEVAAGRDGGGGVSPGEAGGREGPSGSAGAATGSGGAAGEAETVGAAADDEAARAAERGDVGPEQAGAGVGAAGGARQGPGSARDPREQPPSARMAPASVRAETRAAPREAGMRGTAALRAAGDAILERFAPQGRVSPREVRGAFGLGPAETRAVLRALVAAGRARAAGAGRGAHYVLVPPQPGDRRAGREPISPP